MVTLRYYFKIYIMMISQYIKSRMQYRADFMISTIALLVTNISGIVSLWILFLAIPSLENWNFYQMLFMYAFSLLALAPLQIFFSNVWSLRYQIFEGGFIKYYLKPLNTMFYFMSEVIDMKGISQLIFGLIAIIYSSHQLNIHWSVFNIFLLCVTVASASLIMLSLMIIAACAGFWFSNSIALMNFTYKLREFSKYPISIFSSPIRILFTCILPIGFISYYPSQIFLKSHDTGILVYISPFVGIVFFMIAYRVWVKAINSYSGTGT